jgi:hypothetical protein
MHCRLIALAGLAVALAGCGSSELSSSSTPTAAASNEPATTAASEQPTTASASSEPKPRELTGWGATDAAWNSAHTEDSQFSSGSVYNQNPSLQEINGHPGAEYTAVIHQDGHVLNYYYNFQSKSISEAKAEVLSSQFPTETHIVWFADKGSCADLLVQSDALRKALSGKAIGDNEGTALVEFGSRESGAESYDEGAVTNALIMLPAGANPSGTSTAPGC